MGLLSLLKLLFDPIGKITEALSEAYQKKLDAANEKERIEADIEIKTLELQRDVLVKELQYRRTAWMRPVLFVPVAVFWWKLVIWDIVLKLGTTDMPNEYVWWFVTTIPAALFLTRPIEKVLRK